MSLGRVRVIKSSNLRARARLDPCCRPRLGPAWQPVCSSMRRAPASPREPSAQLGCRHGAAAEHSRPCCAPPTQQPHAASVRGRRRTAAVTELVRRVLGRDPLLARAGARALGGARAAPPRAAAARAEGRAARACGGRGAHPRRRPSRRSPPAARPGPSSRPWATGRRGGRSRAAPASDAGSSSASEGEGAPRSPPERRAAATVAARSGRTYPGAAGRQDGDWSVMNASKSPRFDYGLGAAMA